GKTSVIEAVFLCTLGRSHRTPRDSELIKYGCAGGYVGINLKNGTGDDSVEIKLRCNEKKKVFINKQECKKIGELMGVLNAVMFSPEDLSLVKGAPSERRRFADMELSQLYPDYFYSIQRYNKVLKQRNIVLKDDENNYGKGMISVWDEQLASLGTEITLYRRDLIDRLSTVASDIHKMISSSKELLEIEYKADVRAFDKKEDIFDSLMEGLIKNAAEDIRRGYTSIGPHRDDIVIKINGNDVRTYGSQGQQRTAALSLKLSEISLIREIKGEYPILLLDDVFSELDDERQNLLLDATKKCQCFLSCTSINSLKRVKIGDIAVYECKNGTLNLNF
ncbi:MAG: DNA replication/repair protein RecF, partial [Oscillospiraceae bacterium]|nr:DNA replication/repair protein RecF [Oscillospiraceae bacterium]